MKVLVTGAAGPRGRQVVDALRSHQHAVIGVDREDWSSVPEGVTYHRLDHRKRGFEELLRHESVDAIVHLAVHAGFRLPPAERHRLNLEGTGRILELGLAHGINRLVIASHAAVYGALPDNPLFMTEDAPPRVGQAFPEMQDLVTADLLSTTSMWKHPELSAVVLRPVHALGPTARGALTAMLRRKLFPMVLGYDPMVQIIHELDLAEAFALAVEPRVERGVYNVTGPGEMPLSLLATEAGARPLPMPESLLQALPGHLGLPRVRAGALDFLKHPCLIDGRRFRELSGFSPQHGLRETARSPRGARR
jgi:UDP-glucose 4-epimerase